ncbi:MAG TPA: hypothetical protein VKB55_01185 [Nocardioidaceae bacterium]|nr:hypothetical protein [Nocardioidaceae bacterium]
MKVGSAATGTPGGASSSPGDGEPGATGVGDGVPRRPVHVPERREDDLGDESQGALLDVRDQARVADALVGDQVASVVNSNASS